MKTRPASVRLETLRRSRSLPPGATPIGPMVAAILREARPAQRRAATALDVWRSVAPAAIAALVTRVESSGGVLKLTPKAGSGRFIIDRWLRSGGLSALRGGGAGVSSVRIVGAKGRV
jgi:hypothetical protein